MSRESTKQAEKRADLQKFLQQKRREMRDSDEHTPGDGVVVVVPAGDGPTVEYSDDDSAAAPAEGSSTPHVAGEWVQFWDEHYQHPYYYNTRTRASQWHVPEGLNGTAIPGSGDKSTSSEQRRSSAFVEDHTEEGAETTEEEEAWKETERFAVLRAMEVTMELLEEGDEDEGAGEDDVMEEEGGDGANGWWWAVIVVAVWAVMLDGDDDQGRRRR